LFHSSKKRFQLAKLLCGGLIDRHLIRGKANVDGFAFGLIGPFKVRPVAFGRIAVTGTAILSAFHHPFQHCSFAKIANFVDLLSQCFEADSVIGEDRICTGRAGFIHD